MALQLLPHYGRFSKQLGRRLALHKKGIEGYIFCFCNIFYKRQGKYHFNDCKRGKQKEHGVPPEAVKERLADTAALKKTYQYIYAGTGSFGIIYYQITDNDAVDTGTPADWIARFNAPRLKA